MTKQITFDQIKELNRLVDQFDKQCELIKQARAIIGVNLYFSGYNARGAPREEVDAIREYVIAHRIAEAERILGEMAAAGVDIREAKARFRVDNPFAG